MLVGSGSLFTTRVLADAWERGGLLAGTVTELGSYVGGVELVFVAALGVALGLTAVWPFDTYKRYQVVAPVALIATITYHSGLLTTLPVSSAAVGIFVVTVALGAQVGGLPLVQYLYERKVTRLTGSRPVKYPESSLLLAAGVVGIVAAGLADAHLGTAGGGIGATDTLPFFTDVGLGLLLVGSFTFFSRDDETLRIVQIGPARSGKSSMLGGFYTDIRNRTDVVRSDPELERMRNEITEQGFVTGRTSEQYLVEFSYVTDRRLLPEEITVNCLDYRGELITGADGDRLSAEIDTVRRERPYATLPFGLGRLVRALPFTHGGSQWEQAIDELHDDAVGDITPLARFVDDADVVLFTLPMDDFLDRAVERETLPDYCTARVVRELDDGNLEIENDNGGFDEVVREEGRLRYADSDELYTEINFESVDDLRPLGATEYYHLDTDRVDRAEYLIEYEEVISRLNDDIGKTFGWVATKADLLNDDFAANYDEIPETYEETLTEDGADDQAVAAARDHELFTYDRWKQLTTGDRAARKVHAKWLVEGHIAESWSDFDNLLDATFEDLVYPVWFDVESRDPENDRLEIRPGDSETMYGSQLLEELFEGRRLVDEPPLTGSQSVADAGWNVLYAARNQSTDDDS